MPPLSTIQISRYLKPGVLDQGFESELHFFADALESVYGAVCYLKMKDDHACKVLFNVRKSRLAPIKLVTIPRKKLCAAVLAVRLA